MKSITGYLGYPHLTVEQQRDVYAGIIGNESYVLNIGSKFEATLNEGNEIAISDGVAILSRGHAVTIEKGQIDTVKINSASVGYKRIDVIVISHTKDMDTGYDSDELMVIEGEQALEDPEPPSIFGKQVDPITGEKIDMWDIRSNPDMNYQYPLYQVEVDGIEITNITPLFELSQSLNNTTQWNELLLGVAFEHYSSTNHLSVKRSGKVVEVRGIVMPAYELEFKNLSDTYTIANINDEFTPTSTVYSTTTFGYGVVARIRITTSGVVTIGRCFLNGQFYKIPQGFQIPIDITYLLE